MNDIFIPRNEIESQKKIAESLKPRLLGLKACVKTFGCQQNEADSEKISGILAMCGYTMTDAAEEAALVILNTCAIREHAELKALSGAGQLKKLKEASPGMLIGVCGCMAQEKHRRDQIRKSYPYVDLIFGTDMLHRIPEMLKKLSETGKRADFITDIRHAEFGNIGEELPVIRKSAYKAWLSIMYGCDNFCTYCVVPAVRGRERSRGSGDILRDMETLAAQGYKDITLLGQNVNSYNGEMDFPQLLRTLAAVGGDYWLRFMTSHPKDASGRLIALMAENPKIAKHFHLPAQSGSDKILAAMGRGYSKAQYIEKALEIKEKVKDVSVTSDIICGFPGESENDFAQTMEMVEKIGFDMLYTFVFSPRRGTPAYGMSDKLPHSEKVKRFEALTTLQNKKALELNEKFIGRTLRVLSDGEKNGIYTGRSEQNKIVAFDKPVAAGIFTDVKIEKAQQYALSGTNDLKG